MTKDNKIKGGRSSGLRLHGIHRNPTYDFIIV
jgi:hypothetical protein